MYLDHAFRRLDQDGDGFISLDELLDQLPAPVQRVGGPAAEMERRAEAKLMLREADTNGDGKIRCGPCRGHVHATCVGGLRVRKSSLKMRDARWPC